jgi:H+/Cl- antiporter ClcA
MSVEQLLQQQSAVIISKRIDICCCFLQTVLQRFLQAQVQYGYINLEEIFRDSTRLSAVDLSSLLLAKIAATSVCVGGGLVGGLFAPSLFIGALVGDVMGHFVANRCVLCISVT